MAIQRLITQPSRYINISPDCIPNSVLKCRPAETPQTPLSFPTLPQITGEVSHIFPPLLLSTTDVIPPCFPPSPLPLDFTPSPVQVGFPTTQPQFFLSHARVLLFSLQRKCFLLLRHYTNVRNKLQ